ncbi:MAG: Rrf2 family transcriptional regulator [Magnetospirillum sp.]|nr:Rrf2 family transcriptional regulator [Magnetospirillum sp.]
MRLQKATRCALFAVAELAAEPARPISAGEIAAKYGLSLNHLAKVLTELTRSGLIEAVRGAGGGYRFVGDAHRTTLMDVVALFEPVESDDAPQTKEAVALTRMLVSMEGRARAPFLAMTVEEMLKLSGR